MSIVTLTKPVYRSLKSTYRTITSATRLLPDFLIIGAQRGGTTSLYNYLLDQPGVVSASTKEVHFFDTFRFQKGLDWYQAQFPSRLHKYYVEQLRRGPFLTGESSPYYLFHPHAPRRIATPLRQVKLILLLRNPVERAYSHHWFESTAEGETLSFEEAIHQEAERLAGEREKMLDDENYDSYNYRHYSYLARGVYVDQIQTWMSYFPKEQFLILKSEDLYARPAAVVQEVLEFLGVSTDKLDIEHREFKQYREPHKKGYLDNQKPPRMNSEIKASLAEYFKPFNARLYEYLGHDFGWDQ